MKSENIFEATDDLVCLTRSDEALQRGFQKSLNLYQIHTRFQAFLYRLF